MDSNIGKKAAALCAAEMIQSGMTVGLGTGSTATFFIETLANLCKQGLKVTAVATSANSTNLAEKLNIPLVDINTLDSIDITVDGADEIDRELRMIKGGGGALLREKIVASMSKKVVTIVDSSKVVDNLGIFLLPIEVLPFGCRATLVALQTAGFDASLRMNRNEILFTTDNSNYIADIKLPYPCKNPAEINSKLKEIPGVLETGLFLHIATMAIVGYPDGHIEIIEPLT